MARPPSRSVNLKDGYYIELQRSGENKGMKVHRDTPEEIERAIKKYESVYNVVYIGRIENGKVVDDKLKGEKKETKAKSTKSKSSKRKTTKKTAKKKKTK